MKKINLPGKALQQQDRASTKYYAPLFFLLFSFFIQSFAQTGSIKVKVIDKATNEPIPFADVTVSATNTKIKTAQTNLEGEVIIDSLKSGKYNVQVMYVGYNPIRKSSVIVSPDKQTYLKIELQAGSELQSVIVEAYKVPLIDPDTKSGCTVVREEYLHIATKNVNTIVSQSAGIYQADRGGKLSTRGSREDATSYYVDGVRVVGTGKKNRKSRAEQQTLVAPLEDESYNHISENEFRNALHEPLSTFSIDVDNGSYSNMRRFITQGNFPPPDAVRIEEVVNYFTYDYPQPTGELPFSITSSLSECPWNTAHQLIHVGLQGKKIEYADAPAANLVFLIDVSGSMEPENRLPLLKRSFKLLVNELREQDKVAIVVYAGSAGLVLSSTSGKEKEKIMNAIDNLSAGGSTAGGEGILLAYKIAKDNFIKNGNNRVILATDGDFNVGVSSDQELIALIEEKRKEETFLTTIGVGEGNYKDSKLEQLADKGNGNHYYIDNIVEGRKVFATQLGGTINTIAKDVKIQVEFNPALVKGYRLVGYENRALANEDFNDDKKDAGEIGSGHTVTAMYEIIPASSTEKLANIDSLKYQSTGAARSNSNDEVMTIKFRYKEPKGKSSKLIVQSLQKTEFKPIVEAPENLKFSAAVAEFGLLLRDSKFKNTASFKEVIKLAKEAKGNDADGYRAEFIRIVETADLLKASLSKSNK